MRINNQALNENGVFPKVSGQNLLKEKLVIPTQLRGKLNIVIVAFQQWYQNLVGSWVPFFVTISHKYPDIEFDELPTIRKMNFLFRSFINNGMRAGIPSKETRRKTITLYIDKKAFKKDLQISNQRDIHLFLIDRDGKIYWRGEGPFNEKKDQSLLESFQSLI